MELGSDVGSVLGVEVGPVVGGCDGATLGSEVGLVLGDVVGIVLGLRVGEWLGCMLELGCELGAGLLLGVLLGISVGHSSVLSISVQTLIPVMAVGPDSLMSTLEIFSTSIVISWYDFFSLGCTANVLTDPLASNAWTQTSFTTFNKPTSRNSSTGVRNSNEMTPPCSLAFH